METRLKHSRCPLSIPLLFTVLTLRFGQDVSDNCAPSLKKPC